MGIQAAPEVKYALIREAFLRDNNLLKISKMCEIAGVSRSGYYSWCTAEPRRKERDLSDKSDFDLVLEAYRFRGYAKGARGIHMRLLHMDPPVLMNLKNYYECKEDPQIDEKVSSEMSIAYRKPLSQNGKGYADQHYCSEPSQPGIR